MKNESVKNTFSCLKVTETPDFVNSATKVLGIVFFGIPFLMLFLPWQQNISAFGSVTAFAPLERRQTVDAPVSGVISKWYVQEGSKVKTGDVLLEISDIDPLFKDRLSSQRDASLAKLNAKEEELKSYQVQVQNLLTVRDAKIAAANFQLDVARQKVLAASESIASAQATFDAATFQISRMQRLLEDGLVSKRDVEVAERDSIVAQRNLNSAQANFYSAKAEEKSATAQAQQIQADAQASLEVANAVINKIHGEIADSRNSLETSEINLSRQLAQRVTAPRDGTVFRLPVNTESQVITQGQHLLVIIPDTNSRAVELWVDGMDAAIITPGSLVRLEFEGWPAIQVAGWPSVALGTFGGKIAFVDATDDGKGNFRVMVLPDEVDQVWPSERFLRQGGSARAWIVLERVTIGYEIWRVLNGFPPRLIESSAIHTEGSPVAKSKP